MHNTPEHIEKLETNEIFCFGSNFAGNHSGGAARFAVEHFEAIEGVGEGLNGFCYSFPTLNADMSHRSAKELEESKQRLYWTAELNPDLTFLVTKVGTGIAGLSKMYMRELFAGSHPTNIVLPEDWDIADCLCTYFNTPHGHAGDKPQSVDFFCPVHGQQHRDYEGVIGVDARVKEK